MQHFLFGKEHLTAGKALKLANGTVKGSFSEDTVARIKSSSNIVSTIVDKGEPVYGINTGFGPLCTTSISKEESPISPAASVLANVTGNTPSCEKERPLGLKSSE